MHSKPVNLICMKWGSKYGADYVNRLHSMVSRNLDRAHRFICLTDDGEGLNEKIDVFPIPETAADLNDSEGRKRVQAWKKLTTFASPLYDIEGTCLFLDLDIVILDNIDCFFEPEGDFFIIREWGTTQDIGNSSIYRFTAGIFPEVLNYFCENRDRLVSQFDNEQLYLVSKIAETHQVQFWPSDWCLSYRKSCLPKNRIKRWFVPSTEPKSGKVLIFHGAPSPREAIDGKGDRWYRPIRPAAWIEKFWR